MNKLTKIYIARHGQTEWNIKGLIQGHKDSPLTGLGISQAKELAKKLRKIKFDLIFSSDLLRAKRTAEIVAAGHKLAIETSELLRERAFGNYEGKPHHALSAFDKLLDSLKDEERFRYKDSEMESDEEISTRLITFLRETSITHPGRTMLVITHAGTMRAFLIKLGFGTYEELRFGKTIIGNAAYIKVESDGVDFFIKESEGIVKNE